MRIFSKVILLEKQCDSMQKLILSVKRISQIVMFLVILFGLITILLAIYGIVSNSKNTENGDLFHEDVDVVIVEENDDIDEDYVIDNDTYLII